jgi:hypothetical protein
VANLKAFLTDADGNEVPLDRLAPMSWRPRETLKPMRAYRWAIEGQRNGERVRSAVASFQVTDAKSAGAVTAARKRYRDQPLMLAVQCAKAGLLDDAERALKEALKAHPGNAAASALLRNLQTVRRAGN